MTATYLAVDHRFVSEFSQQEEQMLVWYPAVEALATKHWGSMQAPAAAHGAALLCFAMGTSQTVAARRE